MKRFWVDYLVLSNSEGVPFRTIDPDEEFPSLERGRLRFPRPPPTVLEPIVELKDRKGKGKVIPEEDVDWVPENDEDRILEDGPLSPNLEVDERVNNIYMSTTRNPTTSFKSTNQNTTPPNNAHRRPSSEGGADNNPNRDPTLISELIQTIARLNSRLIKTDERVEALESDFRTLSGILKKMMEKGNGSIESERKCGGRIAVSSVF